MADLIDRFVLARGVLQAHIAAKETLICATGAARCAAAPFALQARLCSAIQVQANANTRLLQAHIGCMKRPSFGDASEGRPLYCLQHKQPGHTDLVTKRCAEVCTCTRVLCPPSLPGLCPASTLCALAPQYHVPVRESVVLRPQHIHGRQVGCGKRGSYAYVSDLRAATAGSVARWGGEIGVRVGEVCAGDEGEGHETSARGSVRIDKVDEMEPGGAAASTRTRTPAHRGTWRRSHALFCAQHKV